MEALFQIPVPSVSLRQVLPLFISTEGHNGISRSIQPSRPGLPPLNSSRVSGSRTPVDFLPLISAGLGRCERCARPRCSERERGTRQRKASAERKSLAFLQRAPAAPHRARLSSLGFSRGVSAYSRIPVTAPRLPSLGMARIFNVYTLRYSIGVWPAKSNSIGMMRTGSTWPLTK